VLAGGLAFVGGGVVGRMACWRVGGLGVVYVWGRHIQCWGRGGVLVVVVLDGWGVVTEGLAGGHDRLVVRTLVSGGWVRGGRLVIWCCDVGVAWRFDIGGA